MHHDYHHLRVPTLTRSVRHESVRLYTPVRQNSFNARKYRALRSQRLARIYTLRTSMLVVAVRVRKSTQTYLCATSTNTCTWQCATSITTYECQRLRVPVRHECARLHAPTRHGCQRLHIAQLTTERLRNALKRTKTLTHACALEH